MALTDHTPIGLIVTLRPGPRHARLATANQALSDYSHRLTTIDLEPSAPQRPRSWPPCSCRARVSTRRRAGRWARSARETRCSSRSWSLASRRPALWPRTTRRGRSPSRARSCRRRSRACWWPGSTISPEVRAVAQAAAVLGREFRRPTLERMTGVERHPGRNTRCAGPRWGGRGARSLSGADVCLPPRPDPGSGSQHADRCPSGGAPPAAAPPRGARRGGSRVPSRGAGPSLRARNDLRKALAYLERGAERAVELGATDEAGRLWLRALRAANKLGDEAAAERIRIRISDAPADQR